MGAVKNKKKPVWHDFIHLVRQVRLPWLLIAAAFALNLGRAVIALKIPEKIADITAVDPSGGSSAVAVAGLICLTLFLLALLEFVGGLIATYVTYLAKAGIDRDFQKIALEKVFRLQTTDVEERDPKEFISRITTDTEFISEFLIDLMVNEIPRLYFIISTLIKASQLGNGSLILAFLLVIPVIVIGSLWSGSVSFKAQSQVQNAVAALTAKLAEKVGHVETVKAYNMTEAEISEGDISIDEMKAAQKKTTRAAAFNTLISNILFIVPTLIIALTGASALLSGSVTVQQFITYFGLGSTYQTYIAEHLTLWVLAKKAQGATSRVSEMLLLPDETGGTGKAEGAGTLEFRNVCFSYGNKTILSDLSFTIEPGTKTAIVGRSGAGKSTILNLIEQFYRPDSGSILLDGREISGYEIRQYRDLFSYLPQNAPGFSGTVRDMMVYGSKKTHTDEELQELLNRVGLAESIAELGGLDYEVGTNASRLSGGQRQRLAVARMLLQDGKIVLADESTSALDMEGAGKISKLIDTYAGDKTRVIVSHHLSVVEDADQILVIDGGRLADHGTHEELIRRCEAYRALLNEGKEEDR